MSDEDTDGRERLKASLEEKLDQAVVELQLDAEGTASYLSELLETYLERWVAFHPETAPGTESEIHELYLMVSVGAEMLDRELAQGDWSREVADRWAGFTQPFFDAAEPESPELLRSALTQFREALQGDLRRKAELLRHDCYHYFQSAIEDPASVPPWSQWWKANQKVAERAFSLVDYVRLKHRKLLGARQILTIAGKLPKDFVGKSPLETGSCPDCGERTTRREEGAGGSVVCPNCGVILVYHDPSGPEAAGPASAGPDTTEPEAPAESA